MNVKPGDLAIIIKSIAGNEGKIVKVLYGMGINPEYAGYTWCFGSGYCWMCELSSPGKDIHGNLFSQFPIPDSRLRPISGLPMEEETEQKLKEPA